MARIFLTLGLLTLFLWGCAASPPPAELHTARTAVAKAYAAGAPQYAPGAYRIARAALDHGEALVEEGEFDAAREPLTIASKKGVQAIFRARRVKAEQLERARATAEKAAETAERHRREVAETTPHPQPIPKPRAKMQPPRHKAAPTPTPSSKAKSTSLPPKPPQPVVKYTVSQGETLWTIAARKDIYLDALLWPLIYKANRDQIKDPRQIYPGQVLNIPRDVSQSEIDAARNMARKSTVFPVDVMMKTDRAQN